MSTEEFNNSIISHEKSLINLAKKFTTDSNEVYDLVQETFYRALKNKEKYTPNTNIIGWLYTIMKNTFINQFRKRKKMIMIREDETGLSPLHFIETTSIPSAISQLSYAEIQAQIDHLQDSVKEPLLMYTNGHKYTEIAEEIGVPLGTVKNKIFLARQELKRRLSSSLLTS